MYIYIYIYVYIYLNVLLPDIKPRLGRYSAR